MNSETQVRKVPWFDGHNVIVAYNLAEWLAETYPDWIPMRDELLTLIDRRPKDGIQRTEESV